MFRSNLFKTPSTYPTTKINERETKNEGNYIPGKEKLIVQYIKDSGTGGKLTINEQRVQGMG